MPVASSASLITISDPTSQSCDRSACGVFCKGYVEKEGVVLAPQVGLEPTTLRLTAEIQGEAVRTKKWKSLKTGLVYQSSYAPLRIASQKSSYKSSYINYDPENRAYCMITMPTPWRDTQDRHGNSSRPCCGINVGSSLNNRHPDPSRSGWN